MDPVITPTEMQAIDREAPEPVAELIERAGWAVARTAVELLGRRYGARVAVICGQGNNGADGRAAANYLTRQGVRCQLYDAAALDAGPPLDRSPFDLVIDAAYGTGFRADRPGSRWDPPALGNTPVLAVDIPSGVDGVTGAAGGHPLAATRTVTFAASKPGLLFEPGRSLAGAVEVVDIGLDCGRARVWHLGPKDLAAHWPRPGPTAHKWQRAVWVIGGSPAMPGAPCLAAAGAARGGASYTALSIPGLATAAAPVPIEAVLRPLPATGWASSVVEQAERIRAIVIGPGLPTDEATRAQILTVAAARPELPLVLDGGAIDAVVADPTVLAGRSVPAVLTPHAGELARLLGHRPGPDRLAEGRALAGELGAVIVAKGPTTLAVAPDGEVLVSTAGDQRLATAGTGDVLAGLVGAGLAGGLDPLMAGGLAAELHGGAARAGHDVGFVAGDLPPLVARLLTELTGLTRPGERTESRGEG